MQKKKTINWSYQKSNASMTPKSVQWPIGVKEIFVFLSLYIFTSYLQESFLLIVMVFNSIINRWKYDSSKKKPSYQVSKEKKIEQSPHQSPNLFSRTCVYVPFQSKSKFRRKQPKKMCSVFLFWGRFVGDVLREAVRLQPPLVGSWWKTRGSFCVNEK